MKHFITVFILFFQLLVTLGLKINNNLTFFGLFNSLKLLEMFTSAAQVSKVHSAIKSKFMLGLQIIKPWKMCFFSRDLKMGLVFAVYTVNKAVIAAQGDSTGRKPLCCYRWQMNTLKRVTLVWFKCKMILNG